MYEIYKMVKLKKWSISIAQNLYILGTSCIIKIFVVLHSGHIMPGDQEKTVFYVNNYIDQDQLNQLYDLDQLNKSIQNADAIAYIFWLALTKVINLRLKEA